MRLLILNFTCLLVFACTMDDNCSPDTVRTSIEADKMIVLGFDSTSQRTTLAIEDGDKLFFKYDFEVEQCDNIFDDEWGEKLYFEIPVGTDDFEYFDDELANITCYHLEYGAWVNSLPEAVTEGSIKGTKKSD